MFKFLSKSNKPTKLWFKTDIHCHIVPGVDDGCPDVDTSMRVLGAMNDLGIERVVCSPHVTEASFENTRETLQPAYDALKAAATEAGLGDMLVTYGAENRIDELLLQHFKDGTLITHPNKFVLIENAFVQEPWNIETLIFDLQVKGFQPIFAHPERFSYYHQNPSRYKVLHELIPFQINVLSLAGYYGRTIKKMAETLMEKGMIDYLGTDIHGLRHTDCIAEYLSSSDARRHRKALEGVVRNDRDF